MAGSAPGERQERCLKSSLAGRARDGDLERVCADAGVRLVRVEGRQRYELEGVAGMLAN